jgi:hypothetical protein
VIREISLLLPHRSIPFALSLRQRICEVLQLVLRFLFQSHELGERSVGAGG